MKPSRQMSKYTNAIHVISDESLYGHLCEHVPQTCMIIYFKDTEGNATNLISNSDEK